MTNNNIIKTKIPALSKITLPKKGAFTIETDPDFPKLHSMCIASGTRGSGKSVAIANILKKCKDKNYFDKILLVTPTYNSNKEIWNICGIEPDDVYEPVDGVIKQMIGIVETEKEEYEQYIKNMELFNKFNRDTKKPVNMINPELLISYYEQGYFNTETSIKKPEWKYPVVQPPRIALILDDCLSIPVMARPTQGLTNLCIRHRHIADGLGLSIFMLVQSYCCQGGVPRVIRENVTLLLLFKLKDENQKKKIIEEAGLEISLEKFEEILEYCHSKQFNYLMIDFNPKDKNKQFRSGFDEYLN